ncbi:class I SAM-dependent methyltransferase [Gimesia aquarii]|uniref:Methyltransferase domain protein n=1 Tax=Gimesia aquarii TaxID=2527964 RepID=A0A517VST6_9PLAN|nr:class I SAM-dependent methyltransferase [Gimesia aquarii]QDT96071.1 Methyltransferase domain protein [Gimesia aquarii]
MEHKQCDLCSGTKFEKIGNQDRHGNPLESVICKTCGLVAHGQIPTDEELARYYATEYRQSYHGELTPSERRVMRAWKNGERIFNQLQPHINSNAEVFEVGAGIGCTVKVFELNGHRASGIEPGEGFQNYSQQTLLTDVVRGDLFEQPRDHSRELVLLVHVIEHFNSPRRALEYIRSMLTDTGQFYVECPNIAAPFARRSKMFHYAHIHNFTPSSLKMLVESCGFKLEQQFGSKEDPNLQMLFSCSEKSEPIIDPTNYHQTMRVINEATPLRYHLRPYYFSSRLTKVSSYLKEHLTARQFVADVIQKCQQHAANTHKKILSETRSAA